MGKTRAEIQRAYRQRKKEREGESYLVKERTRIKKYYVPIIERPRKEQKARRDKVRKFVKEHRMRKGLERNQNESNSSNQANDENMIVECDENGVSSSTSASKMIVKMPAFDTKKRTRKRISRVVSKQNREIRSLKEKNIELQKKYKRVSKRYERLNKDKTSTLTHQSHTESTDESMNTSDATGVDDKSQHHAPMTPRKRVANELRDSGISPSKIPKKVQKTLLLGTVLTEEIKDTRKSNGRKGRKVLSNILTGKLMKKYKLKALMNRYTGLSRKADESSSKRCDEVPKQEKQPALRKQKRDKVIEFLQRDDNSRMMPGKNDKVKVNKQHFQKRVLNDNMKFLHLKYKAETGDGMSFATFCRLRPKSISLTRYITKNQCLCQKHQNMALTLKSIRSCGSNAPLNPDEFVRKLEDNKDLVADICVSLPAVVHHEQWKKVLLDDGKRRTKVVGEDLERELFMKKLQDQINEFEQHIARVKQQYRAIGDLKQFLPEGHVISHMDFAENFTCGAPDEVQSAYWNSNAITLHPVVMYYRENSELKHINYVFVSDDLGHNIGSVFAFLKKLIPDVKKSLKCDLQKVHYWTDGPSSQYRNKTAFYIVSNHQEIFGSAADWNYFETGHGKGACDGVGGTAKRMADLCIKQGKISIQEAGDFFEWGVEHHKNARYILVSQEDCASARNEIEGINKNLCPVKGTLQIHHVTAVAKGKVRTMKTSCYCAQCLNGVLHREYDENEVIKEKPAIETQGEAIKTKSSKPKEKVCKDRAPIKENVRKGKSTRKEKDKVEESRLQKGESEEKALNTCTWNINDWVAVIYEYEWHIGKIQDLDREEQDCLVSFMRRDACQGTSAPLFKWPMPVDEIWVSFESLLMVISEPSKIGRSGRKYSILHDEIEAIEDKMKSVK